jgi:integrase
MKGIRRTLGTAQHGRDPLLTADVRRVIGRCPKGLLGLRDRALLLIGFSGAFRRSELSSIDVQNISLHKDGVVAKQANGIVDDYFRRRGLLGLRLAQNTV